MYRNQKRPACMAHRKDYAVMDVNDTWGTSKAYCKFCKMPQAKIMQYKYEDGTGEGEAFFCKGCWDIYKNRQTVTKNYTYRQSKAADMNYFNPIPKPAKKKKK